MLLAELVTGYELLEGYTARFITPDDLSDIFCMLEDKEVTRYLFFAPAEEDIYLQYFMPIVNDTALSIIEGRWPLDPTLIIRSRTGEFAGMAGLTHVDFHEGNYEIGYQLPSRFWGRGIAAAGCSLLAEIAFGLLGAHKISANCYGNNGASSRVLEKCGFRQEGCLKDYYRHGGGFDDKLLYGLSLAEYKKTTGELLEKEITDKSCSFALRDAARGIPG